MTDCVSAYKSQITFVRLALEVNNPRMNAEMRVIMAGL